MSPSVKGSDREQQDRDPTKEKIQTEKLRILWMKQIVITSVTVMNLTFTEETNHHMDKKEQGVTEDRNSFVEKKTIVIEENPSYEQKRDLNDRSAKSTYGKMSDRNETRQGSTCRQARQRNEIGGDLFQRRPNNKMNRKSEKSCERKEDGIGGEGNVYHNYRAGNAKHLVSEMNRNEELHELVGNITVKTLEELEVDEFMRQEEEERLEKERKIAEDATKNIVKARNELADLEAMLTAELKAPDKKVKEIINNNKIQLKRCSNHQELSAREFPRERIRYDIKVSDTRAQVTGINSEVIITSLGRVPSSHVQVNEDIRAIVAAARVCGKAEKAEAERLESAKIHDLLENARNRAKGNRPERRLSVPSEPSVNTSHTSEDYK